MPHQYISVAQRLVCELDLQDGIIAKLASAGLGALDKAVRIITRENREQIAAILVALPERDPVQAIIELSTVGEGNSEEVNRRASRPLRRCYNLPPDLRSEFREKICDATRANNPGARAGETLDERVMPISGLSVTECVELDAFLGQISGSVIDGVLTETQLSRRMARYVESVGAQALSEGIDTITDEYRAPAAARAAPSLPAP